MADSRADGWDGAEFAIAELGVSFTMTTGLAQQSGECAVAGGGACRADKGAGDGAQQRGAGLLGAARSPYAATLAQVESVSQHEIFIC